MPGKRTTWFSNTLLDHIFGRALWQPPEVLYVGLWLEPLTERSTGASPGEVGAKGYQRIAVPNTSRFWPSAGEGVKHLGETVKSVDAAVDWGRVTHLAILDAPKGGNALYVMEARRSKLVEDGDRIELWSGDIEIREG